MAQLGIGGFKRRCMAPFECQNGRIQGMVVGYGCKCANADMTPSACQFCSFRANEFGQHCTRCLGGMYLQSDNRCHDSCDGTGMIEYNPGNCEHASLRFVNVLGVSSPAQHGLMRLCLEPLPG